jgi:hypothetical protein
VSRDIVNPAVFIRDLRREAAGYRSRLAEAEAQVERLRSEHPAEVERLTERVEDMRMRASSAEARLAEAEEAT